MTPTCAERFCKEEIESLVHQIREPKTARPRDEITALVADLVYWNDMLREVERVRDAA
jgi:hypothetical protein